jgi:hypothetical protein
MRPKRPPKRDGQTPILLFIIGLLVLILLAYEGEQASLELGRLQHSGELK